MRRVKTCVGLVSALALSACAVPPPQGPSVVAMPGQGKDMASFQQDDVACRQFAFSQTGGMSAAQAGTNAAVGSAVLGTALGAGLGAALGAVGGAAGAGAAIGGATGLLAGSAIGAGNAQASAAGIQQRYDVAYAQCMAAHGNQVQVPQAFASGYGFGAPPPSYYSWGPAWYGGWWPAWYGPTVAIGVGGGWGWGRGWGWGGWHGGWGGGGWHGGRGWH